MSVIDAILATVDAEPSQRLAGRTLLQKKLYFLSLLIREDFDFHPHYFGPYSTAVSDALGTLVEAGFLTEEVALLGGPIGRFGERRKYTYSLSGSGKKVLESRPKDTAGYQCVLARINAHKVASDQTLLPVAAKVHYILGENDKASAADIRERARELGWDLTDADISQVIEYLKLLDLVPSV